VPPVALALVQLGVGSAVLVVAGYAAVNLLIGNIVEPRVMGRALGLSPLVVFFSVFLWGWLLGPVGALLSVPLTMIVKIAFETSDDLRWLAALMGDPPRPRAGPSSNDDAVAPP
jgi:AI-2 transport protein TqsA